MSELLTSPSVWIAAAITFVAGVLIAALVAAFVNFAARRLLGDQKLAGKVAGVVFWIIVVVGLIVAIGRVATPSATSSGLAAAATRLLTGLPDLLIGLLVVVLGWLLAIAVRGILRRVVERFEPAAADILAPLAYWSILVLTALLAADQVGIEIGLLRELLLLVLGGLVLAAALAIGFGSRDLIAAVVAGRHVEGIVRPGDEVEIAGHRGKVVGLGHASVRLSTETGEVEIPNPHFLAAPLLVWSRAPRQP